MYDEADAWPWTISDVCELCDLDPTSSKAALIAAAVVALPPLLRLWEAAKEEHFSLLEHLSLLDSDCPVCLALLHLGRIQIDHSIATTYLSEMELKEMPRRLREMALDSQVPVGGELMHILRNAADAIDYLGKKNHCSSCDGTGCPCLRWRDWQSMEGCTCGCMECATKPVRPT